jgi:hypothetical protein
MSPREPWLGVASAAGLVVMLLSDGKADLVGFFIAVVPVAYAISAVIAHRRER